MSNLPQELSREAADKFEKALLDDTTPLLPTHDDSVIKAVGVTGQGLIRGTYPIVTVPGLFDVANPRPGARQSVPLRPWRGPRKWRLDRQAEAIRRRLNDPGATMLVMFGTTYSAKSVLGVIWLYIKTKYLCFPRIRKILGR